MHGRATRSRARRTKTISWRTYSRARRLCRPAAVYVLVVPLCVAVCSSARAQSASAPPRGAQLERRPDTSLTPDEVTDRTEFLVESLESRQNYAKWWYRDWLAIYVGTVAVQGTRAAITDHDGARAQQLIDVGKAMIALADLHFRPVRDRYGADSILAMPAESEDERLRRLEAAEKLLKANAKREEARTFWLSHVANFGVNAAGGAILLAIDEPTRAAISTGVGFAFGELRLWTQPHGARGDWREYLRRFGEEPEERWSFGVIPGGVALQYRF